MQLRTDLIELFSTFIRFSNDRFDSWMSDRRLREGMKNHLAHTEHGSQPERFWILYWHQLWRRHSHPQAGAHLNAYLQEPCYGAASRITQHFTTVQWSLADSFQVAIAQADRVLKSYRPDYGSELRAYARNAFSNLIRDQFRQQKDINICSDWGLLRRLSQVQLKRSLMAAGHTQTESSLLVWRCFKAVYTPDPRRSVRALPPPNREQYSQMAKRYNRLRLQCNPTLPHLEVDALANSLNASVQAIRAYLSPTVTSLDQGQFDEAGTTQLDTLSSADAPMEQLIAAELCIEQQQRVQQIENILLDAVAALDPADQTLLSLYYQQALTQTAIAHHLQIQQYQVSRRLNRIRQQLLVKVAQWSQETLHISIESTVLASMSDVIHEWLQMHYQPEGEALNELSI